MCKRQVLLKNDMFFVMCKKVRKYREKHFLALNLVFFRQNTKNIGSL
jgi:hypothetical protein